MQVPCALQKGASARKAAPADFAEAERRAAGEAEWIRQLGSLGYDRDSEEAGAQAACEAATIDLKNKSSAATISGANTADVENLGTRVNEEAWFWREVYFPVSGNTGFELTDWLAVALDPIPRGRRAARADHGSRPFWESEGDFERQVLRAGRA